MPRVHLLCTDQLPPLPTGYARKIPWRTVGGRQEEGGHILWDGEGCTRCADPLDSELR